MKNFITLKTMAKIYHRIIGTDDEYELVHSLELEAIIPEAEPNQARDDQAFVPHAILHILFRRYNLEPSEQDTIADMIDADEYRGKQLRSVSVGDVIVLGETAWLCAPLGWEHHTGVLPTDADH